MEWYIVDKGYVAYLLSCDSNVGYVDYGKKLKLHIGIVCRMGAFNYYIPVSSFKKHKHLNMPNSIDFHKIQNEKTGENYSVLNINNMIPVPDEYIQRLKYDEIEKYRYFEDEKSKIDYVYLLQLEKAIIDSISETIIDKANNLYEKVKEKPNSKLAKRCCNFMLLEQESLNYYEFTSKSINEDGEAAIEKLEKDTQIMDNPIIK